MSHFFSHDTVLNVCKHNWMVSRLIQGPTCWGQTWGTTHGWPTRGPLPTSPTTARTLSTAARGNWTQTDITTVRTLHSLNIVRANSPRGAECLSLDHTTAVGVLNYPSQVEKRSTASTDSPIYSTINTAAAEDDLLAYYDTYSSATYTLGPDPYSSNPVLANGGLVGLEQDLDHWTIQSGQSGSEYAKLQYNKKSKGEGTTFSVRVCLL